MASVIWPSSLPQYVLAAGYEEISPSTTIRTEMTGGVPKVRRNKTAAVRPVRCQLRLSYAQRDVLDGFYGSDTKGGTLVFDWVHPVTRAPVEMMFAGVPTYAPAQNAAHLIASLSLEILP